MRRFAAAALLAAALAACAMEQVAGGVDDGVAAVDKTYYRIPAPVQFAGPAPGIREVTVYVRASGTVVEKHDPMELKMPVGDKNQMVVRVEGGYKQITIETLERIPAEKR